MFGKSDKLVPRNGHTPMVVIVARISGCANQKDVSLEDQIDHAKQLVAELYDGPVEYRIIKTKGKGERLDRPELDELEALIRTRQVDLVVCEDIGRIVRGTEAVRLCGVAVDHGTRVIAPNDCVDTAEAAWEEDVISISRDNVGHNSHTSKRIKHKKMNRFRKFGGATATEIYGYDKPPGSKTYYEWRKSEAAELVYAEWKRILRETLNCSAVADWLSEHQIPLGKYARRKTWNGKMVRRITGNSILKGKPSRGAKHTIKRNEDGIRISVTNPNGPIYLDCPHLAFWTEEEFDEINALLNAKNARHKRKKVNGSDPLLHKPRKRTRFPGQHGTCWYCGRFFVWGGNGIAENLQCTGSREWQCWNSVGFCGPLFVDRLVNVITTELLLLDGFEDQFREMVAQARQDGDSDWPKAWENLLRDEATLARKKEHFLASIASYGPEPMLQDELSAIKKTECELARRRRQLESSRSRPLHLPESIGDVCEVLTDKFRQVARESLEFGNLMRQLVPEFHVYLVRLCDGGHPLPRAKVKLALDSIVPDLQNVAGVEEILRREFTLALFERPPQRERIRAEAVRLAAEGRDQREIARMLPEQATQAAVHKALALDRKMRELGLDSPYVLMVDPPDDYPKLRRHRNKRYHFKALEGYQRPTI